MASQSTSSLNSQGQEAGHPKEDHDSIQRDDVDTSATDKRGPLNPNSFTREWPFQRPARQIEIDENYDCESDESEEDVAVTREGNPPGASEEETVEDDDVHDRLSDVDVDDAEERTPSVNSEEDSLVMPEHIQSKGTKRKREVDTEEEDMVVSKRKAE